MQGSPKLPKGSNLRFIQAIRFLYGYIGSHFGRSKLLDQSVTDQGLGAAGIVALCDEQLLT
jgi:hypothetical protein